MQSEQLDRYIKDHNLNEYFASLFQKVIIEKPKDPIAFLLKEVESGFKSQQKFQGSAPPKLLFVGNWMNDKVLDLVARVFNYPSIGTESQSLNNASSSAQSTLTSYVSSASKENIKTRIDALHFQEAGYSPDILVTTNVTDYEHYLRIKALDETVYSKQQFESDLFMFSEIIDVFAKGAMIVVNGNNEFRPGVLVSRIAFCAKHDHFSPQRFAVLGAPGSGKTVQSKFLSTLFNIPRLNPEEVLISIANEDSDSEIGKAVLAAVNSGEPASVVGNTIINQAMWDRVRNTDCSNGYIFDGYPSNKVQVDFMNEKGLTPEVAVMLKTTRDTCALRVKGRQFHIETGDIYHASFDPAPNANLVMQKQQDSNESNADSMIRKFFIEEESIISSLDSITVVDANENNPISVRHFVVNACYGETPGIQKIFVVGAPLSNLDVVAKSIAKERGLIYINGSNANGEAGTMEIVKRLRSLDCLTKGFVLSDFPRLIEQAELLLEHSIIPTHILVVDLTSDQASARAKSLHYQGNIEKDYFQYIANRGPTLNLFKGLAGNIRYINGAQLQPKVVRDVFNVLDGKKSPLKLIFCGAPGSGKGTQCEVIRDEFHLVHLSTGDMLRDAVKKKTPLGNESAKYMNSGLLVPDSLMEGIIADRLKESDCKENGYILDGFPRTEAQCRFLVESGLIPDAVIQLEVPDEVIVPRITGRRMDPATGNVYHLLFNPPPQEAEDRLIQRSDDTEEKVKVRLVAYHQNVQGILNSFPEQICVVNGNQKKELVSEEIRKYLNRMKKYVQ